LSSFFLNLLFLGKKWEEAASIYSGIAQGYFTKKEAEKRLKEIGF